MVYGAGISTGFTTPGRLDTGQLETITTFSSDIHDGKPGTSGNPNEFTRSADKKEVQLVPSVSGARHFKLTLTNGSTIQHKRGAVPSRS